MKGNPDFPRWSFTHNQPSGSFLRYTGFPSYHAALRVRQQLTTDVAAPACDGGLQAMWRYREALPKWMRPIVRVKLRQLEGTARKPWKWSPEARERFARSKTGVSRLDARKERDARLLLLHLAAF